MKKNDKIAHIFGSLFVLANRIQILGDRIDPEMTIKQWLFIVVVSKFQGNAPTISDIANELGNSRQNVKKMALILEKKGYVTVSKDATDARVNRVSLTQKCDDYFKENDQKGEDFIMELFKDFDEPIVNGMYEGIIRLTNRVIEMEKAYEQE